MLNSFIPDWQCLGKKNINLEEIHCVSGPTCKSFTPDWHCLQKLGFQACSPKASADNGLELLGVLKGEMPGGIGLRVESA